MWFGSKEESSTRAITLWTDMWSEEMEKRLRSFMKEILPEKDAS